MGSDQMPLSPPPGGGTAAPVGALGIMMTAPTAASSGYSWTYSAAAKPFPAYTSMPLTSSFTGVPVALLNAPTGADLNTLRVAYENLRVFTENLAQQHNAISIALRDAGLITS